ncbi:hypothetical protein [Halorubrum trueperi]|uniref:Dodecin domain-containing protein n=1 Tax=Halorubrum trueperi TaxID=2004704 RepID=A0ABD5UI62_9EURY
MADAPERPQVDIMAGEVSVVVTGHEDDSLDDVREAAKETFEQVVETSVENRDNDLRI